MKQLILAIALLSMAGTCPAVTIDLPGYDFADIAGSAVFAAPGESGFTSNYLSPGQDITDAYATTYIHSTGTGARVVDLDFGTDVYDGDGFDLSLFFVGGGAQGHAFRLTLPDNPGAFPDAIAFDSNAYDHHEHTGYNLTGSGYSIFRMDIDLARYGYLGTSPIGTLSLDISNASAVPSLVGAYHLKPAAVVPLPLPVVLFGSGLAVLGLAGRRKR